MKIILQFLIIISPLLLKAQYHTSGYLAGMFSFGKLNTTETFASGPSANSTYAEFDIKYRPISMTALISTHSSKKFGLGLYAGCTLGAGTSKYHYDIVNSSYDVPQSDFNALLDMRLGPQFTYNSTEQEYYIGVRYFNWYNGDGLRSYYGNADDGAAIGVFGAYKRIGVDFNYAPKYFPGILVNNQFNYGQLELRYMPNITFDDGNYSLIFGLRSDFTKYKDQEVVVLNDYTLANGNSNMISIFVGICGNTMKKKK